MLSVLLPPQQMADKAGDYMVEHGIKFIRQSVPTKVELIEDGTPRRLRVEFKNTETGAVESQEYNTVSVRALLLCWSWLSSLSRSCLPLGGLLTLQHSVWTRSGSKCPGL